MEPPMKKCKQYAGTFQSSWNGQFQGVVTPSKLGSNHAWCTVCYRNIKVAVSGVYDVHEHLKSKMHERQLKCPQVTSFFKLKTADSTDSTTKAVVSFAYFVAEHNLPTSLGDHGPPNVHRQRDCKVHKDHADHEMVFVDGRHKASRGAMSKRSRRCEQFIEFEDFTDIEHLGILKHCPTRWLFLLMVVERLLQQLPAVGVLRQP
ncbi:hypothetical protein NP493_662g01122 [Ridgeia piscesae]|uniref:Uncharacterized protein n=1 Tax=Ridgeia piscesae TaxID=27915 RepID=A0AAD9KT93_RIDPI|nr:hypothetical protein NP493_662g01122 [Ridgeia piscesae]